MYTCHIGDISRWHQVATIHYSKQQNNAYGITIRCQPKGWMTNENMTSSSCMHL